MPPWRDLNWYALSFQKNMDTQLAISYAAWLVFILMLAGWIILFMQKREVAVMLASVLFFTLLASSLSLYPVLERMGLFLTPIGILLIGNSLELPSQSLRRFPAISALATLALSGFVLYGPFTSALDQFIKPKYFEHIRPSMAYLQASWKDGDSMFISYGAVPAFEFYAPIYDLADISYESGLREDYKNPDALLKRLEPWMGRPRVWVLMSHVYEREGFNEKDFLLDTLNRNGSKKREFREPGTSVYLYLYDLGE